MNKQIEDWLDETLESFKKYQYQLYVDNDGSHQLNKLEAKQAILERFKEVEEQTKREMIYKIQFRAMELNDTNVPVNEATFIAVTELSEELTGAEE